MSKKNSKTASAQLAEVKTFPQELPILTSVGMHKIDGLYVPYVIKTQGDKVVSFEPEEPNTKAIALSVAKINFVKKIQDYDYE
jgi:hypothetical protein